MKKPYELPDKETLDKNREELIRYEELRAFISKKAKKSPRPEYDEIIDILDLSAELVNGSSYDDTLKDSIYFILS